MELIKVKELAGKLKVSSGKVYRLANENKIPCVKIGKSFRFDYDAVIKRLQGANDETANGI
jgi:excisionase family DNA binding protein